MDKVHCIKFLTGLFSCCSYSDASGNGNRYAVLPEVIQLRDEWPLPFHGLDRLLHPTDAHRLLSLQSPLNSQQSEGNQGGGKATDASLNLEQTKTG